MTATSDSPTCTCPSARDLIGPALNEQTAPACIVHRPKPDSAGAAVALTTTTPWPAVSGADFQGALTWT